jgi:hypothetical protein
LAAPLKTTFLRGIPTTVNLILPELNERPINRVGQDRLCSVCTHFFGQGNHQAYGHIRCMYMYIWFWPALPMYGTYFCSECNLFSFLQQFSGFYTIYILYGIRHTCTCTRLYAVHTQTKIIHTVLANPSHARCSYSTWNLYVWFGPTLLMLHSAVREA